MVVVVLRCSVKTVFLQAHHQHYPHTPHTDPASLRTSMPSGEDEEQRLLDKSYSTKTEEKKEDVQY